MREKHVHINAFMLPVPFPGQDVVFMVGNDQDKTSC